MDTLLKEICKIVKACGGILLHANREAMRIDAKSGAANFVTEYDQKAQDYLYEKLGELLPTAQFIGEEDVHRTSLQQGLCFLVDPIDGTTNFIKDYHVSCISVALLENARVQIGVIYNPYLDELFCAKRGGGAYCNGKPIQVSSQPLEQGIVLFGTSPYVKELAAESFKMAYEYHMRCLDVRRSGSAAQDLCSIAAGRAELYFEMQLSPWDYAAGSLLVTEAGGTVSTMGGEALSFSKPCSILARNR